MFWRETHIFYLFALLIGQSLCERRAKLFVGRWKRHDVLRLAVNVKFGKLTHCCTIESMICGNINSRALKYQQKIKLKS
jgi:hypothetical protein